MTPMNKRMLVLFAAILTPTAAAIALSWWVAQHSLAGSEWRTRLVPVVAATPRGLTHLFRFYKYAWPPQAPVPPLGLEKLPSGLGHLPIAEKKALFFRVVLPLAIAANNRIRRERSYLRRILPRLGDASGNRLPQRLLRLARKYQVSQSLGTAAGRAQLLRRCDTVPLGLILAQAAKESGWGTSKFARGANNLFGIWTWKPEAGVVPTGRAEGATHLVRVYPDLAHSVADYLYNLNVGFAYRRFRARRAVMRTTAKPLDPLALAATLVAYSQHRALYTSQVTRLIRNNKLERLGDPRLSPALVSPGATRRSPPQGRSVRLKSQ